MDTLHELMFREWGRAFGIAPAPQEGDTEPEPERASVLAKESVDTTRQASVAIRDPALYRTPGVVRRMLQRQVGNRCKLPSWAASETIRAPRSFGGGSCAPPEMSPGAELIETLVLSLQRWDRRAALAMRAHYCLLGRRPLSERIAWVAQKSETKVSRIGYRAALARGRMQIEHALVTGAKKIG
jgi:hypothetical protein